MSELDAVLIDRLIQVNPLPKWLTEAMAKINRTTTPCDYVKDEERRTYSDYDERRIAYFIEKGRQYGVDTFTPIEIDTTWHGRWATPGPPVVMDGHHRLGAAVYLAVKRIPASCGGLVTTIDWLTGKTDKFPDECL
jgi:hypothetical protein